MRWEVTLSPKGQVTIPKEMREALKLRPGDQLIYSVVDGEVGRRRMMVFGLDTNIVIRLFINDDPVQREAALQFGENLGRDYSAFVTLIGLLELDWALRSQYGYNRKDVTFAIDRLLHTRGLIVENHTLS
jgi:AbrB family looped-hinge helix DNA binding protein